MQHFTIGVDEAGRGPLAGPVSVGVALVPVDFDWAHIPDVNDSKKLTEKKREEIFEIAKKLKKEGKLDYAVSMVGAKAIDTNGIVSSITIGMNRTLQRVIKNTMVNRSMEKFGYKKIFVKLDGGLKAPEEFIHQETIIKGDSKEKTIGLASIIAKVTRDRYMVRKSALPQFSPYTFAQHKGYGTKKHREAIAKYGLSEEHRKSYCKNIALL